MPRGQHSLSFPAAVRVLTQNPSDPRNGATNGYENLSEALTLIQAGERYLGLPFRVKHPNFDTNGEYVEYHFQGGILDEHAVIKQSSSKASTTENDTNWNNTEFPTVGAVLDEVKDQLDELFDKYHVTRKVDTFAELPTDGKDMESVFVVDASGDPTVESGWAIYKSIGDQPSGDWVKIAEQESIDINLDFLVEKEEAGTQAKIQPADQDNDEGFWASLLSGNKMSLKSALDRIVAKWNTLGTFAFLSDLAGFPLSEGNIYLGDSNGLAQSTPTILEWTATPTDAGQKRNILGILARFITAPGISMDLLGSRKITGISCKTVANTLLVANLTGSRLIVNNIKIIITSLVVGDSVGSTPCSVSIGTNVDRNNLISTLTLDAPVLNKVYDIEPTQLALDIDSNNLSIRVGTVPTTHDTYNIMVIVYADAI